MTPGQILGTILLAMVVSAAGTWKVQDWRYSERLADQAGQFQTDLGLVSAAAAKQASAATDKRLALGQQLVGQDQQHTKELSDAPRNQAVLRDRLATSDVRLSVLLDAADSASGCNVPAAPGAVGVVHAAARVQLDPAHAQ
jgi:hypothetical protein